MLAGGEKDVDGLRALHKALKSPVLHLAIDLLGAGDSASAAKELKGKSDLASRVWREAALEDCEDWQELYDAIQERLGTLTNDSQKELAEGKMRWLLAEKLQGTEAAWEAYSQLHEQYPEDRGILEALARIAGARGESGLALQYLGGLANLAQESQEKARITATLRSIKRRRCGFRRQPG